MARTTFDGPILAGDTRIGPLRNVGTPLLTQNIYLDFSNTTVGTYGYAGSSGQFVTSNNIENTNTTIYTPSTSVYPPVANTPTADAALAVYRGCVFYIPANSSIYSITVDVTAVLTNSGTTQAYALYVSNNFATATGVYASASLTNSAGARSTLTYSPSQLPLAQSTPIDIPVVNMGGMSQIVFTFGFTAASGTVSPIGGKAFITLNYTQGDLSIGSPTVYPYGNLT